jgi:uncharacterized protein
VRSGGAGRVPPHLCVAGLALLESGRAVTHHFRSMLTVSTFTRGLTAWAFALLAFASFGVHAAEPSGFAPIPPLSTRVTDTSATLNLAEQSALDAKLRAIEKQNGGQIAILIVPTALPETIDQFALRVAEAWKIGKKGKDNGALIVLAMQEKKVRIEVGYGWEGALPDVEAKRIIREVMSPYFKAGKFGEGLGAAVDKIALTLSKDVANVVPQQEWDKSHHATTGDELGDSLLGMAPMLLGAFAVLSFMLPSLIVGLIGGIGGFMFTGSVPVAAALGIGGFVVAGILKSVFGGLRNNIGAGNGMRRVTRSGGVGPGIWIPGGFGGGGGGGSLPDIFSGGGGGFGGGGASGGWGDGE